MMATKLQTTNLSAQCNTVVIDGKRHLIGHLHNAKAALNNIRRQGKEPVCEAVMGSAVEQAMAIIRGSKS